MTTVDFYFDFSSPYSYLASTRLKRLEGLGARIALHPVFLGGIMNELGITPPARRPGHARAAYLLEDLQRWADVYGIAFAMPSVFPMNTLRALRAWSFVERERKEWDWMHSIFDAVWGGAGLDVSQLDVLRDRAEAIGVDPQVLVREVESSEAKDRLKADTTSAIERGVFGVPTFFIGEEMYFGNDRIHFVEARLQGRPLRRTDDRGPGHSQAG